MSVGRKYILLSITCLDSTAGEYYMNLVTKLETREAGRGRDNQQMGSPANVRGAERPSIFGTGVAGIYLDRY